LRFEREPAIVVGMRSLVCASAVALTLSLSALPARATSRHDALEARRAEHAGLLHEHKKQWTEAIADYRRSLELRDAPDVRLHLAHAEAELGHLLEAESDLKAVLSARHTSYRLRYRAKHGLSEIQRHIPTLTLILPRGFDGTVSVDGNAVDASALNAPLPLDPGAHDLHVRADGYRGFERSVSLEPGDQKTLDVHLTPEASSELAPAATPAATDSQKKHSSTLQTTLGVLSLGVGVAGVGVGVGMALASRATKNELSGACVNNVCDPSQHSLYEHGKQQADVATAGFIVGGVGLATGIVLLLTLPKHPSEESARIEPIVGPTSVGVRGRF
jgi:hypothetical protein